MPEIEKILAGGQGWMPPMRPGKTATPRLLTPRALSMRAWRRERLAAALDWPAAEDQARRDAPAAERGGFDTASAAGTPRGGRRPAATHQSKQRAPGEHD